eukprot:9392067-Pyramimonas_sp.AAC.1
MRTERGVQMWRRWRRGCNNTNGGASCASGTCRRIEFFRGELNSSVVKWLIKGLADRFRLWRFSGVDENNLGELNSPVVEWLNKGLTAVWSPTRCRRRSAEVPNR